MQNTVEDQNGKCEMRKQIPPLSKWGSPPQLLLLGSHEKHSWSFYLGYHTCMLS